MNGVSSWIHTSRIILLSILVGITAAFGTSLFFEVIRLFSFVARLGRTVLGARLMFLIPVAGMLLTAMVVKQLGPRGFGHGFPEVIRAVKRRDSRIRPGLTLKKVLSSALCIAWGGVVGRVGPVTHIGAMLGSVLGRLMHVPTHLLKVLVGCGAAAAISASFNAPLAGVLFASEVVLRQFNVNVVVPLVVASVIGASVPRPIVGAPIVFDIPVFHSLGAAELPLFLLLGLCSGCLSVFFIISLRGQFKFFPALKIGWSGRAILAGLVIGLVGMMVPEVLRINHGMTTEFLHGRMDAWLLLTVAVVLPVMTPLTLAGGGSGGIFTPSLAMGAALGGGFGRLLQYLPWDVSDPGAYAVAGAAAALAGAVRSPLTAMVLIMEVTGNHGMLLPLMTASVASIFLSRVLSRESALTVTRMEFDTDTAWVAIMRDIYVDEMMEKDCLTVPAETSARDINALIENQASDRVCFVVERNGYLIGSLHPADLADIPPGRAGRNLRARDVAQPERVLLTPESDALGAFHEFGIRSASELPVVNNLGARQLMGVLKRATLLERYHHENSAGWYT